MRRAIVPLLVVGALVFGVASAGGRSLSSTTIVVEVFGQGQVTSSSPNTGLSCGNGKTKCYLTFTSGGTVTLTQSAATGWSFDSWGGDCVVVGGNCTIDASGTADKIVDATFASTGAGTTQSTLSVAYDKTNGNGFVSAPENAPHGSIIDCGTDGTTPTTSCAWTVLTGSTLTLFQTPAAGASFSGWGGACSGTAQSCSVHMTSDKSVSAAWIAAGTTKALSVSVTGNGTVSGGGIHCPSTCTASEPLNSAVTLSASPASGYAFTGWGGDCSGTGSTCTVTMSDVMSVSATFAPAVSLSVTVKGAGNVSGGSGAINCGSGASICSGNFAQNASVTLVATPATGATFNGWSGACGGTSTTCTVSMVASRSVTANFSSGFGLTVTVTGSGTVIGGGINCGSEGAICSVIEAANGNVTLSETPDSGSSFTSWGGACTGSATTCTVSMTSAKSVSATFSTGSGGGSSPRLSVAVSGSGTVSGGGISCGNGAVTCSATETAGASVTLSETPASGARFTGWGGSCSGTAATCTVTVNGATSVTATFTTTTKKPPPHRAVLTSLGLPVVRHVGAGFQVTLRFRTTIGGVARVHGRRAGRVASTLSLRLAAGPASIRIPVVKPGSYVFTVQIGTRSISWRACLGICGSALKSPPFVVTRESPVATRAGDGWSLVLHAQANLISDVRVVASRGGRKVVNLHVLGSAGQIAIPPFLLGPGNYTLRLTATDAYGRVRTLIWIVALAR